MGVFKANGFSFAYKDSFLDWRKMTTQQFANTPKMNENRFLSFQYSEQVPDKIIQCWNSSDEMLSGIILSYIEI